MNTAFLQQLGCEVGTPLYVFDGPAAVERAAYLKRYLPEATGLCYAIKANPFLIKTLEPVVDRFEVCSPGEYDICVKAGIPMKKVLISGVVKAASDTRRMMQQSPDIGCYTIESLQQAAQLNDAALQQQRTVKVILRLTQGSQFGMDRQEVLQVIRERDQYPGLEICGLHYFSGTQKKIRRMLKELDMLQELIAQIRSDYGFTIGELEYGPGLPVSYFEDPDAPDDSLEQEQTLLKALGEKLAEVQQQTPVTVELGRGLAAYCGTYLTSVVDQKSNSGEAYALVDGGIHHIAYYGQMMAMKRPFIQHLPKRSQGETLPWNICGSLCTTNDILVKGLPLQDLQVGDMLAFERAGAYCVMEGISLFLSRALPAVVMTNEDGTYQILRGHEDTYPLNCPV